MRKELAGFVAELRGPLLLNPAAVTPRIVMETELEKPDATQTSYSSRVYIYF